MNINIISRGKGKSAVGAAAYRAGTLIKNEYDGQIHDYSRKEGVVFTELFFPVDAPDSDDRAALWNAVEKIEKAKNAQLAREVRLALPAEFTLEQNINLVHEYVKHNFVMEGMCADICIHDKLDGNPHAHVLLTMRPFERDGSWGAKSKMEYILDDNGERIKLPSGRPKTKKISTTGWDERSNAETWRKAWQDSLNQHLENNGYETRVDHRSYERQGVEQLPTIHMGVSASQMEEKGIRTERGDINRRIKAANAKLKTLDEQIHNIKNPPKPKMIIDLENSIKAQDSPAYANWAKIFNLQQAAHTLLYIQENGFTDIDSLQSSHQQAKTDHADIQKQIRDVKAKVKSLTAQKEQAEIYRKTLDVYKKYNAPGQISYFKNQYHDKHKNDIEAHKKAKAYIYDELKLEKFPSLKKLSGEINKLHEQEKALRASLPDANKKITSLNIITHNARMLLGYDKLESQHLDHATVPQDLRAIPVYKSSFVEAEKAGKLDVYFQNTQLNRECAVAIQQAISKHKTFLSTLNYTKYDYEAAANEVSAMYGRGRVEYVLAAAVESDMQNKFADYKEWASQKKLPVEPHGIHVPIRDDLLCGFIKHIQDNPLQISVADTWGKNISFADKLASAERRVKEQSQSRTTPAPQKKRNDEAR